MVVMLDFVEPIGDVLTRVDAGLDPGRLHVATMRALIAVRSWRAPSVIASGHFVSQPSRNRKPADREVGLSLRPKAPQDFYVG
jgi:hypothetical protein